MTTDPYAHLEDGRDPATVAWQEASNRAARAWLDADPERPRLRDRFDRLLRAGSLGAPRARGARLFFASRTGSQEQTRISVGEGAAGDRLLLDPLTLDPSGLTAIDWWYPSPSGAYLAYGLSHRGDEYSTLAVLDVATGGALAESIPLTRSASLAWLPDETGFYYTRYDRVDADQRVRFHRLGDPPADDRAVFGEGRPADDAYGCELSPDGRWLVVSVHRGWAANEVYLADRSRPSGDDRFVPLVTGFTTRAEVRPGLRGLVALSTEDAPRGRVFLIDPARPARAEWQEILAEGDDALEFAVPVAGGVVLGWLRAVRARVAVRDDAGTLREVPLGLGSVTDVAADPESSQAYLATTSFFEPARILRVACETGAVTTWRTLEAPIDLARYTASQTWAVSRDGTRVPAFVLAREGTPRDGSAPLVLYGYGGFNVALTPSFMPSVVPWLDAGGVYAIANLRGGSEFGEAWHAAGMRERKQNVFDDFAAVAEHLGRERYGDPARVAVWGGSNGGLLVTALATQRPELARAVVCAVPVIDMLRYHLFSIGRYWIPEYGDPEVPEDAAFLRAYSPYERVVAGTDYPAMLLRAAMADSRVDPMHARKFTAKVRDAAPDRAEMILCQIESDAGHGAGKPRSLQLDELADEWSFVARVLGVEVARLAVP